MQASTLNMNFEYLQHLVEHSFMQVYLIIFIDKSVTDIPPQPQKDT